ncbi:MAG: hypothetical protein WC421_01105 [Elusimicrobiales bacterium]
MSEITAVAQDDSSKKKTTFSVNLSGWKTGALTLLIFTVYYAWYTRVTTMDVAWFSYLTQLQIADKLFTHTLTFKDMFVRYGEHGLLGHNIISLANIAWFRLNTLFDAYLNVGIVAGCGAIAYYACRSSFGDRRGLYAQIPLLLLCVLMFSVLQEACTGDMETQVRLGTLSFMTAAYAMSRYMLNPHKKFPALEITLLFLSVNIFGTLYSISWQPALAGLMVFDCIARRRFEKNYVWIFAAMVACWVLYCYQYQYNPFLKSDPAQPGILGKMAMMAAHPYEPMKSIFAYLGSATLNGFLFFDGVIPHPRVFTVNGLFVFSVYVYAAVVYFRTGMYQKTFLPPMMMAYTFFIIILVQLGRPGDWSWGTSYWYTVHVKFGLAACVWILGLDLLERRAAAAAQAGRTSEIRAVTAAYAVVAAVLLAVQIYSSYRDWRRAPYVMQWFEGIANYALNPDGTVIDAAGTTPMRLSSEDSRRAIEIMRKYKLSVYRNRAAGQNGIITLGRDLHAAKLVSGWHTWEGSNIWMAKTAEAYFVSGPKGKMVLSAYLPDNYLPNKITLFADDRQIGEYSLDKGSGTVNIEVENLPQNAPVRLKIVMDRMFVPKTAGFGPDERELGLLVSGIEFQ